MAQAACQFLNERLFKREDSEANKAKRTKRRSANAPLIKDLVQFFIESEVGKGRNYPSKYIFCSEYTAWFLERVTGM